MLHVNRERDGKLIDIVIDNPKGNVLSGAVMAELDAALAEQAGSARLRLVTIRGAGSNFSFGASVEEHQKDRAAEMLQGFHALVRRIGAYPVPVAALVDGRCLGGAFELTLACHFVLATERAMFACPEIKLGVFPPVLAALGAWRLGAAWTERLLLTGGELDATTAAGIGFVTRLVPGGDAMFPAALEWYDATFDGLSAFSLRHAVAAVRRGALADFEDGIASAERLYLESLLPSHDGNEGITAFLEKRKPEWSDA